MARYEPAALGAFGRLEKRVTTHPTATAQRPVQCLTRLPGCACGQLQDRGAANMPTRAGQQGDWAIELTQTLRRDQGAVRLQGLHKRP
jgi:hypothetical protein